MIRYAKIIILGIALLLMLNSTFNDANIHYSQFYLLNNGNATSVIITMGVAIVYGLLAFPFVFPLKWNKRTFFVFVITTFFLAIALIGKLVILESEAEKVLLSSIGRLVADEVLIITMMGGIWKNYKAGKDSKNPIAEQGQQQVS